MRILIDARHLREREPGGVGGYTQELLRALFSMDAKHRYALLTSGRRKPDLAFARYGHVAHHHDPTPNKLLNLALLLNRRRDLAVTGNPDVVFFPNLNIASLPGGIPFVVTVHDLSFLHFPQCYSPKMRLWHRAIRAERTVFRADRVICPSENTARDVHDALGVPRERVRVIPHGVSREFAPRMRASDHGVRSRLGLPKRFVLFVGTHEPRKNLPAVIEAVQAYRSRTGDDLRLVLAGAHGWQRRGLDRMLNDARYRSWIRPLGYIPAADRPALYRAADAFLWPSLYEGFGLPVLEAMASATPVITSHTSSLPEVAGSGAILVNPYDPGEISQALEQLLASPALAERLRTRGLARAGGFSWDASARRTLAALEEAGR